MELPLELVNELLSFCSPITRTVLFYTHSQFRELLLHRADYLRLSLEQLTIYHDALNGRFKIDPKTADEVWHILSIIRGKHGNQFDDTSSLAVQCIDVFKGRDGGGGRLSDEPPFQLAD